MFIGEQPGDQAKPAYGEIRACKPWLEAELRVFQPEVIVCLGATAAQALLGKDFRVTKQRGQPIHSEYAQVVLPTVHPSVVAEVLSGNGGRGRGMAPSVGG